LAGHNKRQEADGDLFLFFPLNQHYFYLISISPFLSFVERERESEGEREKSISLDLEKGINVSIIYYYKRSSLLLRLALHCFAKLVDVCNATFGMPEGVQSNDG